MSTLVGMATTTTGDGPFSRIVETKQTTSWALGAPIAIFVVLAVALIAYFAAKNTQAREQLAQIQQGSEQSQQAMAQIQQKLASVDTEMSKLRDPGRTTVILQSAAAGSATAKRGRAATNATWGAATWGEQTDGKTWLRLNSYGLNPAPTGKTYDLWFVSSSGDSILMGKVDPNTEGSAFAEGKDLPAVDQGKTVLVSLDDEGAKTPGQPVAQAALPKMTPSPHAAPAASSDQAAAGSDNAQAEGKGQAAQGKQPPPKKR